MVPDLRSRLTAGEFLIGSWLTILDPTVPELMAGAGFDLLVADGEHGPIATSDLVQMLIATRAAGVPVLYRVAANEPVRIMHALDAGASGVVVPQIRTVADAERAVAWCRYPPVGLRGIAPAARVRVRPPHRRVPRLGQRPRHVLHPDRDPRSARRPRRDPRRAGHRHHPDRPERPGGGDRSHRRHRPPRQRGRDRPDPRPHPVHGVPAGVWTASVAQARARRDQGFAWATLGTDYGFMQSAADAAARDVRGP